MTLLRKEGQKCLGQYNTFDDNRSQHTLTNLYTILQSIMIIKIILKANCHIFPKR